MIKIWIHYAVKKVPMMVLISRVMITNAKIIVILNYLDQINGWRPANFWCWLEAFLSADFDFKSKHKRSQPNKMRGEIQLLDS